MSPHEEPVKVPPQLSLRPAGERDCELLWQWRNEESTRQWSFHSDSIPYEEHKRWFLGKLKSADSLMLIISDKSRGDIGQVRFNMSPDGSAEVNISISAAERHRGYGSNALRLACRYVQRKFKIVRVIAHIKVGNEASIAAFARAGFIHKGLLEFKGHNAVTMLLGQPSE